MLKSVSTRWPAMAVFHSGGCIAAVIAPIPGHNATGTTKTHGAFVWSRSHRLAAGLLERR